MTKSMMKYNDKVERGEPIITNFFYKVTGAETLTDFAANAMMTIFTGPTQAVIDSFLGSTNEFLAVGFGTTAMAAGVFGGIIDLGGQLKELVYLRVTTKAGTAMITTAEKTLFSDTTALPDTKTNNVQVSSAGNVAFHVVMEDIDGSTGDIDTITAGLIQVQIAWRSK